jgi:glucose-6-phosphate-specific signal transduction histidine kinase
MYTFKLNHNNESDMEIYIELEEDKSLIDIESLSRQNAIDSKHDDVGEELGAINSNQRDDVEETLETSEQQEKETEIPIITNEKTINKPINERVPLLRPNLNDLEKTANEQIKLIGDMKARGIVIETDEHAQEQILLAQESIRQVLALKYGEGPYFIEMSLHFPPDISSRDTVNGDDEILLFELAPAE